MPSIHEFVSEIVQQNSLRDDDEPITFDCHTKNCRIAVAIVLSVLIGIPALICGVCYCFARNSRQENHNINVTSSIQLNELSPLITTKQESSLIQ